MAKKKIQHLENEAESDSADREQPQTDVPTVEIPQPAAPVFVQDDEAKAPTISSIPFEPAAPQPTAPPMPQYSPAPAPPRLYMGKGKPEGVILTAIYHFIIGLPFIMVGLILLLIPVPAVLFTVRDTLPLTLALIAIGFVIFFFILCGVIPIIAGIGLLRMRNWARWLAIAIALLSLPVFPIGTLTGALVLVYLLSDSVRQAFAD
jgi:hypothetical protein